MNPHVSLLLSLLAVDLLAAMTPGPNFLAVSQMAMERGRRKALEVVFGFLTANLIWAVGVALGLTATFTLIPWLYGVMKVAGGVYLIYLGLSNWLKRSAAESPAEAFPPKTPVGAHSAYVRGFLIAMLNPKSVVYFGSIFTLFMRPGTPAWVQGIAIAIVCFNTVFWYGAVGVLFSSGRVRQLYSVIRRPIDRVAGAIMILFGGRLVIAQD